MDTLLAHLMLIGALGGFGWLAVYLSDKVKRPRFKVHQIVTVRKGVHRNFTGHIVDYNSHDKTYDVQIYNVIVTVEEKDLRRVKF